MIDSYEVLERFSIIAESEGDERAFQIIRETYGEKWLRWIKGEIDK